jgi:hypothetical protein
VNLSILASTEVRLFRFSEFGSYSSSWKINLVIYFSLFSSTENLIFLTNELVDHNINFTLSATKLVENLKTNILASRLQETVFTSNRDCMIRSLSRIQFFQIIQTS